jgi:tetratricopeptide (TPR) repeat protein
MLHFGNIPTARRSLERSLALQPKQPEAARMLAAIYLASGDGPRGARLLEQAAEQDPHDFRARFALGKVYHDLGELTKSAEAYDEALKRQPPEPEATQSRIGRIRALLDANLQGEATADLEAALREAPENAEILGLAARQAADLGRASEARDLADRALRADPENFDARLVRARLRFLDGQLQPALEDLAAARAINPNHLGALQLQAQVQARAGRADEAERTREEFRRARERLELMDRLTREITRNPDDPEPRWRMGRAAAEGGMGTLAFQCFQAALDIDRGYQPAQEGLAKLRESGLIPESAAAPPANGALRPPHGPDWRRR